MSVKPGKWRERMRHIREGAIFHQQPKMCQCEQRGKTSYPDDEGICGICYKQTDAAPPDHDPGIPDAVRIAAGWCLDDARKAAEVGLKPLPIGHPDRFDRLCGVYFVQWRGYIKIGYAWDVISRVRAIGYSIPEGDVIPLGFINAPSYGNWFSHVSRMEIEADAHAKLAAYRVRGEWFRDCPEVRAFIAKHAKAWPTK